MEGVTQISEYVYVNNQTNSVKFFGDEMTGLKQMIQMHGLQHFMMPVQIFQIKLQDVQVRLKELHLFKLVKTKYLVIWDFFKK